ncbi:hypothetical protein [Luteolibacter sp. LG18]|uniref:hypothetical protein n=1 Tax=Luteolibacter sp. LG18 TaxID=2819286 RepID=UPI002B2A68C2|nr:hypothetical protein llg_14720 [Luteolibacter sp. LG18]
MNLRTLFVSCGFALVSAAAAHGQIAATLSIAKTQYVAGESVQATVTITNHSGQEAVFVGSDRQPWLDFVIKRTGSEPAIPYGRFNFGAIRIPVGQSMARQVNLSSAFNLTEIGNYSVYALIRMPDQTSEGTASNRVLFNVSNGRAYWSQKVGVRGDATKVREYRVLNYSGDQKTQLYVQVVNDRTGTPIRTYPLGDALMFRKPQITVAGNQNLHVFFLSTPTLWTHCEIDTEGKLVNSEFHRRGATGDPVLMTQPNGVVAVGNSIPYDPKAEEMEKSRARKISERPVITQ